MSLDTGLPWPKQNRVDWSRLMQGWLLLDPHGDFLITFEKLKSKPLREK